MKIAGLQKNSFVDYPEKMAAVIFTPGCNMNCYYCHNRSLISCEADVPLLDMDEVLKLLDSRKKFLDGVVISGGEPTLQRGLIDFIRKLKVMGYRVKLDTNGTHTVLLKNLISEQLIDYAAMDIKAPFDKYESICGRKVPMDQIHHSIRTLLEGKIDYEFRTTFVPYLDSDDIREIARMIEGAALYALQQYRRPEHAGEIVDCRIYHAPHDGEYIRQAACEAEKYVKRCITRGLN